MKSWLRQILAILLLGVSLILLFHLSPILMREEIVTGDDFVQYWLAGQLNLQGVDPYSPEHLRPVQLQVGWRQTVPLMMWNPPWTLPLIMPFAALDYPYARLLWFLVQTALLFFSATFIWRLYGGSPNRSWVAWLIAFTFYPTLYQLRKGQIGAVVLFGAVLFLMFSQRQTWWLAGLSLLFIAVKPQTLFIAEFAILFWAISRRRWDLMAGCVISALLAVGISLFFNPMVLKQYFYAITHQPPPLERWATPTIGSTLRYFLGADKMWLQIVPTVLGVIWFCFYWLKERHTWNWPEQMPILVAVSVLTTSYGWVHDYVVLLLVILPVAAGVLQRGMNRAALQAMAPYLAIDAVALAASCSNVINEEFWFMWLAPALVGWYFLTVRLQVNEDCSRP